MKATSASLILGIAGTCVPGFAAPVDLSKLPAASDKQGVTYAKDIRPLFEASCFRCHGEQRPRADLRLDSLEAVLKGGEDGKVVVPGKSKESLLLIAVAQLDDETAMPPKAGQRRGGPGGPPDGRFGGPNGGGPPPGGPGGDRGGPGRMMAQQMLAQGDKNADQKLSKEEFAALADGWFDKLDPENSGKLSQEQFTAKFSELLPPRQGPGAGGPPDGGPPGGGPQRGGGRGPGRFIAQGFFTAADTDKDGLVTRSEFKNTFAKWFGDWDTDKSGSLDENRLNEGLNAALPRPNFGGPGGRGGPGGFGGGPGGPGGFGGFGGGPGGPDGGGNSGPPPKPLTSEQVGLVRAWIDQGAK